MVQNHRDHRPRPPDLLRRSAGHDELQGMANDLHDGDLRSIRRFRQKHHHHHDKERGRMARGEEKVKANGERPTGQLVNWSTGQLVDWSTGQLETNKFY